MRENSVLKKETFYLTNLQIFLDSFSEIGQFSGKMFEIYSTSYPIQPKHRNSQNVGISKFFFSKNSL